MYTRGLRGRIPANVRSRAEKAGFQDPDWYAGPLVEEDDVQSLPAARDPELQEQTSDSELEQQLDEQIDRAVLTRQMRGRVPLVQRLLHPLLRIVRQPSAR